MSFIIALIFALIAAVFGDNHPASPKPDETPPNQESPSVVEVPVVIDEIPISHRFYVHAGSEDADPQIIMVDESAKAIYEMLASEFLVKTITTANGTQFIKEGFSITCSKIEVLTDPTNPVFVCAQRVTDTADLEGTTKYFEDTYPEVDHDSIEVFGLEIEGNSAKILFDHSVQASEDILDTATHRITERRGYGIHCQETIDKLSNTTKVFCHEFISSAGEAFPGSADPIIRIGGTGRYGANEHTGPNLEIPRFGWESIGLKPFAIQSDDDSLISFD